MTSPDEDTPLQVEPIDYFASPSHPRLRRFASSISLRARRKMFARFMQTTRPSAHDLIVDVGVTPDTSLPESNYFEQWYPHLDHVTATSVEDAKNLEDRYPGLTFIRTAGVELPFEDQQFDLAFCSAVLEHVGTRDNQQKFVNELLRVSRSVYVLTPNRWFPVDFHTMLPLIHWLPQRMHQRLLRALGLEFWSRTENLNLLSGRQLTALFPSETVVATGTHRTLGMPSNLTVYASTMVSKE